MKYTIPGYELGEKLGEGQYGVVFKARHIELNQERAVKVLKENNRKTYARYRREMKALSQINHPHIVQFYEYGRLEDNTLYFVMEYIEGKTLEEELKECSYSPEEAVERILPLLNALQAIHSKGIIHRDIKPGNILIDKRGRPYLTDFGLAKGKEDEGVTQTGQMIGTPKYMSPEQTLGEKDKIDHQTDIYSLGVVLYELLTGQVPHDGNNMFELLHNINEKKIIPPSKLNKRIPKDIDHICLRMLKKKKKTRYQDIGDVEEDCEMFLNGEAIERKYNINKRIYQFLREYNRAVTGIICGFIVLLGGIGYVQYKNYELDVILKKQEKYKNKLEDEVRLLEKGKEKNSQMIRVMRYIDILENGNIPAKLSSSEGSRIIKQELNLVDLELQDYVQGLLIRNKGYRAPTYEKYIENMIQAGEHFLEAFALSDNNLWYLSLGYECHHLNVHYHKVGHVGVREINKYFYKNSQLLFPENKQFLLFVSNINDGKLQSGGSSLGTYRRTVNYKEMVNDIQKLYRQLIEKPKYIAGYFTLGVISGSPNISRNLYNNLFGSDIFDKLIEGQIRHPLSPSMINRIVYENYKNAVINFGFKNELQFTSMLKTALKINPYHISNLHLLMEVERFRYIAYRKKEDIKKSVKIADQLGKMHEEYIKYFTYKELLKKSKYKSSTKIEQQLMGMGAMLRINEDRVAVYLHAKEYEKELETIRKIRNARKYDALGKGEGEHDWASSSMQKNRYYLRKAQLLEYFGKYNEALEEYRLTKKLYTDKSFLEKDDKNYILRNTVVNSINKKIYELEKKVK